MVRVTAEGLRPAFDRHQHPLGFIVGFHREKLIVERVALCIKRLRRPVPMGILRLVLSRGSGKHRFPMLVDAAEGSSIHAVEEFGILECAADPI